MQNALFNVKQVQEILGVSERSVFRYIKDGELRGFKLGKEWRFEQSDIDDFILRRRQATIQQLEQHKEEAKEGKQEDKEPLPA